MSAAGPLVHIVNPMWNAFGGSEQRALRLYELLRPRANVFLWSEHRPDSRLAARVPIRRIDASQQPRGGTLVVIGFYFPLGDWLASAHPQRVILVVNTLGQRVYEANLDLVSRTGRPVELVFASASLQRTLALPGRVEASPIDLDRFSPATAARPRDAFVAGRMSRDTPEKHHQEDPSLYAELARRGCRVRIMGGTCLDGRCPPEVELLPPGAMAPEELLRQLDCFVYRTAWFESYGRVVVEAMACGLPIVVDRSGGYMELVEDGENGLAFDTTAQAVEQVMRLREDDDLRGRLGRRARETILRLYSAEQVEGTARYYLG